MLILPAKPRLLPQVFIASTVIKFRPLLTHPLSKSNSPRHPPPICLTLPPLPTLLTLSVLSLHPIIPSTLSGPPTAFLLSSLLSNLSLFPKTSPLYSTLLSLVPPPAISLLLLQPSPPTTTTSRPLIYSFFLGAFATTLGALLATCLPWLPAHLSWSLAAAFAATYIGGSLNYVAIVNALAIPAGPAAAGLAADLALMAGYFAALFVLAAPHREPPASPRKKLSHDIQSPHEKNSFSMLFDSLLRRMRRVVGPLLLTVPIVMVSRAIATTLRLPTGCDLMLMSVCAVLCSKVGGLKEELSESGKVGDVLLTVFFATLGASTRISAVWGAAPGVAAVGLVVLTVHALVMYVVGRRMLRLPVRELLLASNANVGGASTAGGFAAALGWKGLVPGAVFVGTLGYMIGTPVALIIFGLGKGLGLY